MAPHVVIHNAVSVDGRIDGFVPDIARYYELAGTWTVDAHLVGADTLIEAEEATGPEELAAENADPAAETESGSETDQPLLVVPDSRGRVTDWASIRDQPYWGDVLVFCSENTPGKYVDELREDGIQHETVGDDHVDLHAAIASLEDRGVGTILVDSGGTLNGRLLDGDLVNEVSVLIHPVVVGGTSARPFVRGPDPDAATDLHLDAVEELDGRFVWLRYTVA